MDIDFHKQTHNACLAYALWNIGAITEKDVQDYEESLPPLVNILGPYNPVVVKLQRLWVEGVAPNFPTDQFLTFTGITGALKANIDITGKTGVLIVGMFAKQEPVQPFGEHALSVIDGKVLDPDGDGQLEDWDTYLLRERSDIVEIRKIAFWEKTA